MLFNTKSYLYINIKYIYFGLVGFYGISVIVGNLMSNPVNIYQLNIYDLKTNFVDKIFKRAWRHFLSAQLNGFKFWDLTQIILFNVNHLFTDSEVVTSIAI